MVRPPLHVHPLGRPRDSPRRPSLTGAWRRAATTERLRGAANRLAWDQWHPWGVQPWPSLVARPAGIYRTRAVFYCEIEVVGVMTLWDLILEAIVSTPAHTRKAACGDRLGPTKGNRLYQPHRRQGGQWDHHSRTTTLSALSARRLPCIDLSKYGGITPPGTGGIIWVR